MIYHRFFPPALSINYGKTQNLPLEMSVSHYVLFFFALQALSSAYKLKLDMSYC